MKVSLEAIKFNHDPKFETTGAFNIRRNEKDDVSIPEWEAAGSNKHEDSLAAYALDKVNCIEVTIKAKFSCSDVSATNVKVKAILEEAAKPGAGSPPENCTGNSSSEILAETLETEITLVRGESGFEKFVLQQARAWETGVSVRDVNWRWLYSPAAGKWFEFAVSHHRIYTVITRPKFPWKPDSTDRSDTQLPWAAALDHACAWAATATHVDDAATRITRKLNSLGHDSGLVFYNNPNSGAINFTRQQPFVFECSDFLQLLNGHKTLQGRAVNCDDCAAIVVTFANILGCDLNEGNMGPPKFALKRHLRIGSPSTGNGTFKYHNVAWKGNCGEDNEVFDACLQLDAAANPSLPPKWFVPTNILFGQPGQHEYRFRLAADPASCKPKRDPRRRRIGLRGSRKLGESEPDFVKLSEANPFISRYVLRKNALLAWQYADSQFIEISDTSFLNESFWNHQTGADASIAIDFYVCDSFESALEILSMVLSTFELPDLTFKKEANFGDLVFAVPTNYAIVFVRNEFVFRLRNTGLRLVPCDDFARFIDALLTNVLEWA
jgi:hypothetical protein